MRNLLLDEERKIKAAFRSTDINVMAVCQRLLDHFKEIDHVENSQHSAAIYLLYRTDQKLTKENIAQKMFIPVAELRNNRRNYVKYFKYYLLIDDTGREAAAS